MQYLRARYYAPVTGSFISKDSWTGDSKQPMSYHKWLYGYSNPVMNTDPSGLCPEGSSPTAMNCRNKVRFLELTYDFILYWPDRNNDGWDDLIIDKIYMPDIEYGCDLGSFGPEELIKRKAYLNKKFLRWTDTDVYLLEEALNDLNTVLGQPNVIEMVKGGVLFRTGEMSSGKSHAAMCNEGNCTSEYLAFNENEVPYVIGISDSWALQSDPVKVYLLMHEFGHWIRIERDLRGAAFTMYRIYNVLGYPARLNANKDSDSEYFADTFASYVWEINNPGQPNPWGGSTIGSGPLSSIVDSNPFEPSENLFDYFERVVLPEIK